ncbi:MAG: hypothetical protein BIFFINMI_04095 [Phycisphaerae bacterium]|nr:hypothetical protein [Phycisphaerae bacterium]
MIRVLFVLVVLWLGLAGCASADGPSSGGVVVNPLVRTDRSVDASSVQAMVDSLVTPGMSDRDKALAIFNYVRRTMFHYRHLTEVGGGGAMELIGGVGYCLCTPTAGAQVELCRAAGLEAKILGLPGHGSVVVKWDGRWHWMDAFLGLAVWNRDRTDIATVEEVAADPTLLTRDNPGPVPLLPCVDELYADSLRFEPDNEKYHKECSPDDADWARRASLKPDKRIDSYWKSETTSGITLRPGETFVRNWDNEPGMYILMKVGEKFAPPHHFCGVDAEMRDTVNWPYFKPYVREITSFDPKSGKQVTVKTGRYWANGTLTWNLPLGDADLLKWLDRAENIKAVGGKLAPIDPSKPVVLEWTTHCPYMLVGGSLGVAGSDIAGAWVRTSAKGECVPLKINVGDYTHRIDLREPLAKAKGARTCTFRVQLSVGLPEMLRCHLIFQHNMYAQPQLMPGDNKVTVAVADAEDLKAAKLAVELAWDEQGRTRTERRVVDTSPFTFAIEVKEKEIPRMRHLTLSCRK